MLLLIFHLLLELMESLLLVLLELRPIAFAKEMTQGFQIAEFQLHTNHPTPQADRMRSLLLMLAQPRLFTNTSNQAPTIPQMPQQTHLLKGAESQQKNP